MFLFFVGIFVPLDSRSAARCARAPQLAQSWDYFDLVFFSKNFFLFRAASSDDNEVHGTLCGLGCTNVGAWVVNWGYYY